VNRDKLLLEPNHLSATGWEDETVMNNLRTALVGSLYLAMALFSGCELFSKQGPGRVVDTWEYANNYFRLRITAYDEKGVYPAPSGGYYVFESSQADIENWQTIMTFRHDDPVKIRSDQVRFVNEQVGYVFMGWLYAVTTDGGRTWSVWDASKDPVLSRTYNYDLIRQVSISPDGNGHMDLNLTGNKEEQLRTQDYGRHWTPK
jgi:hypothetical protein